MAELNEMEPRGTVQGKGDMQERRGRRGKWGDGAACGKLALRVLFFDCSSTLPFLFMRLQACVQRNLLGLILWWNKASTFELMKKLILPSLATKRFPRPG